MVSSARRVLVVGADKPLAVSAFDRCAPEADFVNLAAFSTADVHEPGPALVHDVDRAMADDPFDAIVATSESTMLAAGFLRSRYGFPGLAFDPTVTVTNKWRMRSVLRDRVRSPEAWLSGDFLRTADVPETVVIKPLSSSSARGVRLLPSAEAREWLVRDGGLWLVEEAVPVQREFHCDGAIRDGQVQWAEMSEYDRPVLVSHGTRTTSILSRDDLLRPALSDSLDQVIRSLAVDTGVFHVELLHTGSELYFGEVGLRPAGTGIAELLQLTSGADLWATYVSSQLGDTDAGHGPSRAPHETAGLVMARPSLDGQPPMARAEASTLPGVTATSDGNMPIGAEPSTMCDFEYLAFFEGLDRPDVLRLRDAVSGAAVIQ